MIWVLWIASGVSPLLFFLWFRERDQRKRLQMELSFTQTLSEKLPALERELLQKEGEKVRLEAQIELYDQKIALITDLQRELKHAFASLSSEALEKNNRNFLDLAKSAFDRLQDAAKVDLDKRQGAILEMISPVKETLSKLDQGIRVIEKERKGDQESLKAQVQSLLDNEKQLKQETSNLVRALRTPLARGRWGEMQLKRVVELAGMLSHCDFFEQQQDVTEEGRLRPDLVVRLPGGRQVVIDAKVPLEAYLEAIHSETEELRTLAFLNHARQVRAHVTALSKKAYWERFQPTPEFVVLFLPAETFFSAALEWDPSLIEMGAQNNVIIATPTTLIALLRAVAYGWRQENLSHQVQALHGLGQDLYKRLGDMTSHFSKMGRSLASAVDSYNKGIGSLETRVLVTARKFKDFGAVSSQVEIEAPECIEKITRDLLPEADNSEMSSL